MVQSIVGKRLLILLVLLMSGSSVSAQQDQSRDLTITRGGQYERDIDVTYWVEGEDYVHIYDFFISWDGQDTINYWIEDGILYVDSLARGINLIKASIQDIENPKLVVSAHTDPQHTPLLARLPKLESVSFVALDDDLNLSCLTSMQGLRVLWLNSTDLADSQLVHLAGLTQLRELEFYDNEQITDQGLGHLRGLGKLRKLGLGYTGVTDSGLAYLEGLGELRALNLSTTRVTDSGLTHLKGLARLEELNLWNTAVTDSGLTLISHLSQLRELTLNGTPVTDQGLAYLADLDNLRELNLEYTGIKGPGLGSLEGLQNLTILGLRGSPITGKAVPYLSKLKNLKLLDLADTRLKPREVEKIRQALPYCEIIYFIRPPR